MGISFFDLVYFLVWYFITGFIGGLARGYADSSLRDVGKGFLSTKLGGYVIMVVVGVIASIVAPSYKYLVIYLVVLTFETFIGKPFKDYLIDKKNLPNATAQVIVATVTIVAVWFLYLIIQLLIG